MSVQQRVYENNREQMAEAREKGAPVLLSSLFTNDPNSAGGVNVRGVYYPLVSADNAIKYMTLEVVPYNAVQDPVASSVGGDIVQRVRVTGPEYDVEGSYSYMMFSNVWYNHSIVCTQLNSITIELMDGTTIEYDDDFSDIMNQSLMEASTCSGEPRYKSPQI